MIVVFNSKPQPSNTTQSTKILYLPFQLSIIGKRIFSQWDNYYKYHLSLLLTYNNNFIIQTRNSNNKLFLKFYFSSINILIEYYLIYTLIWYFVKACNDFNIDGKLLSFLLKIEFMKLLQIIMQMFLNNLKLHYLVSVLSFWLVSMNTFFTSCLFIALWILYAGKSMILI